MLAHSDALVHQGIRSLSPGGAHLGPRIHAQSTIVAMNMEPTKGCCSGGTCLSASMMEAGSNGNEINIGVASRIRATT
jgi:hypothetical protein